MREDWKCLREPGLVHVVVTAGDAASAYRVFDALVDRFPAVDAPARLGAPPGLVSLAFVTPTAPTAPTAPAAPAAPTIPAPPAPPPVRSAGPASYGTRHPGHNGQPRCTADTELPESE